MVKFQLNAKSAVAVIFIASVMFGFIGPFNRKLGELGFTTMEISFYKSFVSVLAFGIVMLIINRTLFKVKKEHILILLILGVFKGVMDITFIGSQTEISLSLSTVLQMTAPYFLILFGALFLKERVTKRKVTAVIIGTAAACLISNIFTNPGSIGAMGVVMGLLSAVTMAGYLTLSAVLLRKGYSVLTILFYAFFISMLLTIPTTPFLDSLPTFTNHSETIFYVIGIGLLCTAIPTMLNVVGIKYLDVTVATVLSMLEIVVSAIVGTILYGEDMNLLMIFGMVLLLASMLLINEKKQEDDAKTEEDSNS